MASATFQQTRALRGGALASALVIAVACITDSGASTLIVPDEAGSIQMAIDSQADTILVRPGVYPETPTVSRPGTFICGLSGDADNLPILAGLRIHIYDTAIYPQLFAFSRLRISSQVIYVNDRELCDISFVECQLDAGIADGSQFIDTFNVTLQGCRVRGRSIILARGTALIDSCTVEGEIVAGGSPDIVLIVRNSTFQGQGTGHAIGSGGGSACFVEGNTIRGYLFGCSVDAETQVVVSNNLIEDCTERGLYAGTALVTVENNTVRRCRAGMQVYSRGTVDVMGNTVESCWARGVSVRGESGRVSHNVVSRNSVDGLMVVGSEFSSITVTRNVSAFNGGSGFAWDGEPSRGGRWTHNIGYRNQQYGMKWLTPDPGAVVGCNDWFGNVAGAVSGQPPSIGDIAVEPMFCDSTNGDYRLNAASSLVDYNGCGQVGALGVGCEVTETLVQRFTAARTGEGVRVVWKVAEGSTAVDIWLERSEAAEGRGWSRPLMDRSYESGAVVDLDRSAYLHQAYWYRLVALDDGAVTVVGAPIRVEAMAQVEFRLTEIGPNPGNGPVRIGFALKHGAAVEIEVFDIQGRRVASPGHGSWAPGTHEVVWDGNTKGGELAPAGMYVVRYAYPGGQDRRAIVRVR